MDHRPVFDAVRVMLERGFRLDEVAALDAAIELAATGETAPAITHTLGAAGKALIQKWEGCAKRRADGMVEAYPDPGSADGHPWTIGWGSTGADIGPGIVWTQAQCDARFDRDIQRYIEDVRRAVEAAPTTPNQFDALVSFHYNTGAIAKATLTKLHKEGKFDSAKAAFANWIYNDGKPMNGLRHRRADEAKLYGTP
jgi:lysozyme